MYTVVLCRSAILWDVQEPEFWLLSSVFFDKKEENGAAPESVMEAEVPQP